jgi:hypothetical protein
MAAEPKTNNDKFVRVRGATHALLTWLVKHDRRGNQIEEVAVIVEEAVERRGFDPKTLEPVDQSTQAVPTPG